MSALGWAWVVGAGLGLGRRWAGAWVIGTGRGLGRRWAGLGSLALGGAWVVGAESLRDERDESLTNGVGWDGDGNSMGQEMKEMRA